MDDIKIFHQGRRIIVGTIWSQGLKDGDLITVALSRLRQWRPEAGKQRRWEEVVYQPDDVSASQGQRTDLQEVEPWMCQAMPEHLQWLMARTGELRRIKERREASPSGEQLVLAFLASMTTEDALSRVESEMLWIEAGICTADQRLLEMRSLVRAMAQQEWLEEREVSLEQTHEMVQEIADLFRPDVKVHPGGGAAEDLAGIHTQERRLERELHRREAEMMARVRMEHARKREAEIATDIARLKLVEEWLAGEAQGVSFDRHARSEPGNEWRRRLLLSRVREAAYRRAERQRMWVESESNAARMMVVALQQRLEGTNARELYEELERRVERFPLLARSRFADGTSGCEVRERMARKKRWTTVNMDEEQRIREDDLWATSNLRPEDIRERGRVAEVVVCEQRTAIEVGEAERMELEMEAEAERRTGGVWSGDQAQMEADAWEEYDRTCLRLDEAEESFDKCLRQRLQRHTQPKPEHRPKPHQHAEAAGATHVVLQCQPGEPSDDSDAAPQGGALGRNSSWMANAQETKGVAQMREFERAQKRREVQKAEAARRRTAQMEEAAARREPGGVVQPGQRAPMQPGQRAQHPMAQEDDLGSADSWIVTCMRAAVLQGEGAGGDDSWVDDVREARKGASAITANRSEPEKTVGAAVDN